MNRRTFLVGALAGTASFRSLIRPSLAASAVPLRIGTRSIEVNGRAATVYGLTGPDGLSGLRLDAGTNFNVALRNDLKEETIIHWHGLTPPWEADGVAGAPRPPMTAGETRMYDFPVGEGGTHWMHAHTLQEQNLLAAPLVVRTAADRAADEQEVTVLLHDFSFKAPDEILAGLTKSGGGMPPMQGMAGMDHGDGGMDHGGMDHGTMHHSMGGMAAMDLNDVDYDAYLANDRTLDDPEVVRAQAGGRVRLRLINGAASTAFTIDTGALRAEAIAVDGRPIHPVGGRLFPLTMGQRLDLRLRIPRSGGAFPILARREGAVERTGLILATQGAAVKRIPMKGPMKGPVLDLAFEARLKAASPPVAKPASRQIAVDLTGGMAPYSWAMEGGPVHVRRGERVEITLRNQSMMAHPMHLHGHYFQVVAFDGTRIQGAVRDTILVPPMRSVTIGVDALNPGKWAFHCHHLYHMATGMMSTFAYEDVA